MPTPDIDLTPDERSLFDRIVFDPGHLTYETHHANADLVEKLFRSLADREAVPDHRRRWFTDPEFFPNGRGKSRNDMFVRNGTAGDDIVRHPHFLAYLRYFVCGPDLPANVIAAFREKAASCEPITSGDIDPLGKLARSLTRQYRLEPHNGSEEFYKLALDCGMESYADFIRRDVRGVKLKR